MTEEVKQAIEDLVTEKTSGFYARQSGRDFVAEVEAKLSPKHSKKGTICLVTTKGLDHWHLKYALGDGLFDSWAGSESGQKFDHYREIPTAQDALSAMGERFDGNGSRPTAWSRDFIKMYDICAEAVQSLIDNAMEG